MSDAGQTARMVSDLIVVPVLLLTLGVVGLYTGWKRRKIYAQLAATAPTPVRELSDPGVVEVEGDASPVEDPLSAPITGREAVVAAWTIEEWDERGRTSQWREVARGIEMIPFEVDDGTASVAVEPVSRRETAGKWTQTTGVSAADGVRIDDVLAEFESFPVQTEHPPEEEPPDELRQLHDDHGRYTDTGSLTNAVDTGKKHGRRRYAEQVLEPGDHVYVRGRVEASEEPTRSRFRPRDATVTHPEEGLLVLSNQDASSLEGEFASSSRTRFVFGAVSTVVGAVGVVYLLPI